MPISKEAVSKAAATLMDEHERKAAFRPFVAAIGIETFTDAYAVQRDYVRLQIQSRNTRAIGYKVGATSPRVQAMCGISSPMSGVVLEDRVYASGARLDARDYGGLALEFEIAVRLGRDLVTHELVVIDDVAAAVDAVCPAVEIIDDRRCDYTILDTRSVIADNGFNAGIVLGTFVASWPDLATIEGVVSSNGGVVDQGSGADVLGHPFHAVAWLANYLAETKELLRAGDIVMTGSMVTPHHPTRSSLIRFDTGELGSVKLEIAM